LRETPRKSDRRTILRYIKWQGSRFADKIGLEPFDEYSESWPKESFSFESLKGIISKSRCKVYKDGRSVEAEVNLWESSRRPTESSHY
jgi:hypothetical protein